LDIISLRIVEGNDGLSPILPMVVEVGNPLAPRLLSLLATDFSLSSKYRKYISQGV
jgi:hypothetical protein